MCGSSAPPPPPDYTQQRQAAAEAENANRAAQAQTYNEQVSEYNTGLTGFSNQLTEIGDSLANLDINNIGGFDYSRPDLTGLRNSLNNYNFNQTSPNFTPTITSYGEAVSVDTPILNKVDSQLRSSMLNNIDQYISRYDNLNDARDSAIAADQSFRDDTNNAINNFWSGANRADIYAPGALDSLFSQYTQLNNRVNNYDSQLNDARFDGVQGNLAGVSDWLNQQQGIYDTEQGRIDSFRSGLDENIFNYGNALDGLSIADLEGINALDQQIAGDVRSMMNFQSPIATDFSSYMNSMGLMDDQVDALRDARTAEEGRIAADRSGMANLLNSLSRDIPNNSLFVGSNFDYGNNQLDQIRDMINTYSSELNPQFNQELDQLAGVQNLLDSRFQERRNAIDSITNEAELSRQSAMDAELWDEDAMRQAMADIKENQFSLNRYTGGQVADDKAQLSNAMDAINARLGELGDFRTGIEGRAQTLLDQVNQTQFYGLDDVSSMRALYDQLEGERGQYNAIQANDELADVLSILNANQGRIETDIASREARQAREAELAGSNLFGIDRNYILSELENTNMTPEEYAALVSRVQEQDPEFANTITQQYGHLFGV